MTNTAIRTPTAPSKHRADATPLHRVLELLQSHRRRHGARPRRVELANQRSSASVEYDLLAGLGLGIRTPILTVAPGGSQGSKRAFPDLNKAALRLFFGPVCQS